MKKRLAIVVLVLLLSSLFVVAQEEQKECGFWCKVNEFLFGSAEARAGKGWFERGLTGKDV